MFNIKNMALRMYGKTIDKLIVLYEASQVSRYKQNGLIISHVNQGAGGITIAGDLKNFSIDPTSHLKSGTFIECSGGVSIGQYFHTGRGLTIFSTNHNYASTDYIPYDSKQISRPVKICDFVWIGSNVSIVPGVTVGTGAIVGMGSVLTRDVPEYAIVGGNPAEIIGYRDANIFNDLRNQGKFF